MVLATEPELTLKTVGGFFESSIGFVVTAWCGREEDERTVKDQTSATTRVILPGPGLGDQRCAVCGRPATMEVAWGKAY